MSTVMAAAPVVPDFVTHYHLADRPPFLTLTDLDEAGRADVLAGLAALGASGASHRRFGRRYVDLRRATEQRLHDGFVARGGRPRRPRPWYFVLGECPWFRGLYRDVAEVRVALADLPTDQVSITCPDSMVAMGVLAEAGVAVRERPYHREVFRVDELPELVARHGRPEGAVPDSYEGHQYADVEHYVEVQVWTARPPGQSPR